MNARRLILFNTSVLTGYGTYVYKPISLEEARHLVREYVGSGQPVVSAIGHPSTAALLTDLLDFPVVASRQEEKQSVDDVGLIFKLKRRPLEAAILSREELEAIGYEFGLLTRTA